MSDSNQTPDAEVIEDARDRLVDRVLAEAVGGETPPDVTASVIERAEASRVDVLPSLDPQERDRALRWLAGAGTVAALLLVTVSLMPPQADNAAGGDEIAFGKARVGAAEPVIVLRGLPEETAPGLQVEVAASEGSGNANPPSTMGLQGLVNDGLASEAEADGTIRPEVRYDWAGEQRLQATESKPGPVWRQYVGDGAHLDVAPSAAPTPSALAELSQQAPSDALGVLADAETWRRITPAREKYRSVDVAGQPSTPAPANQPGAAGRRFVMDSTGAIRIRVDQPVAGSVVQSAPAQMGRAKPKSSTTGTNFAFRDGRAAGGRYDDYYRANGVEPELGDLDQSRLRRGASSEAFGLKRLASERPLGLDFGGWVPERNSERYTAPPENQFTTPAGGDALSTFSVDVDTASYTNARRFLLQERRLPPPAAVRLEEFVNYFDYGYAAPGAESEDPFAASMEVGRCPWKPRHRLVRIGIQGREAAADKRPLSNLVFLVDVSGSMNSPDKLPLVVAGLEALTDRLGENDRVAIVVYAGSEGLVLPSTSGLKKDEIRSALGRLRAGGSTAGGAGLRLAYEIAERNKIPGGVNRVVLCTDGDFNVGLTGTEELAKLVEARGKEQGIFLTVLGFGRGNLNDAMLEAISGRGDGHYAYIDSEREARRVLSRDLAGTLVTIAKDVKLQVEFNPAKVASYRLIGYENRVLAAEDFNDDTKDAGEIGAGHTVTALYEIVPVGVETPAPPVDGLKYQEPAVGGGQSAVAEPDAESESPTEFSNELLTLKIRYKKPTGGASKKLEFPLTDLSEIADVDSAGPSSDFRWSAAVAEFGLLLRNSRHAGEASFDHVLETARGAVGEDPHGQRAEFLDLVRAAKQASGR